MKRVKAVFLCAMTFAVWGSQDVLAVPSEAEACLKYAIKTYREGQIARVVHQSRIDEKTIRIENYQQKIGTQWVSSVVTGMLSVEQEHAARFLCLTGEKGKPLFFNLKMLDE